jgi:type I restriction enzyme, S subunit
MEGRERGSWSWTGANLGKVPQFDLLASAPGSVTRLRELILALAVRGKLVPQDAKDEPANVLLSNIHKERTSPEVSVRYRRATYSPIASNSDEPFEIPSSWVWARLGEISTFGDCEKAIEIADTTWVLDLEDIEKDTGRIARRVTFAERRSLSNKNVFRTEDVLYGKLRPYLNKVAVADANGVCTTEILPFHGFGRINPRYLRTVIQSPYFLAYVNAKSYGMKMPRLGTDDGRNAWIPLPPLAEQHRIVARVKELMKLCDALEQSGRLADEQHVRLTSTLFDALAASESAQELAENWGRVAECFDLLLDRIGAVDALEQTALRLAVCGLLVKQDEAEESAARFLERLDLAPKSQKRSLLSPPSQHEIPRSWEWCRIDEITTVGTGTTPSRTNPAYFEPAEFPWVNSGETGQPFITSTTQSVSALALRETSLKLYPPGTLVVAMYGQGKTRGQIAELVISATTNQACAAIVPIKADEHHRRYLKLVFEKSYDELREEAAGGAQPNLNVGKIKSKLIPLPPLAEQRRIVERFEDVRSLCNQLRDQLRAARLVQSDLADAMVAEAVNA